MTEQSTEGRSASSHDQRLEVLSAILLALAAVATAWCSYQATRWSGEQSQHYSDASTARVQAAQLANYAHQKISIHIGLFLEYTAAVSEKNNILAEFLFERFPKELKTATVAWLALDPLENPEAPPSPFAMPDYRLGEDADAASLSRIAEDKFNQANLDNDISDDYVLVTVIFASVLFFGGISSKFSSLKVKTGIIVMGGLIFLTTLTILLTFPVI
jgi:hypothetical protein